MEVVIVADDDAIGAVMAAAVIRVVNAHPDAALGLATGSSPLSTYRRLITACAAGEVTFAGCSAYLLDEYVGIPLDHPAAYHRVIRDELTDHIDIDPARVYGPPGDADDLAAGAAAYDAAVVAARIEIQILGVGTDGHIAFNEPTSSLASRTRIKSLTQQTRVDNARFFGGDIDAVPHHVLTQGIGTILDARHLILAASGTSKAPAVKALVEGPVSAMVPASALQLHPHATIVVDEAAAAHLELADYYRAVFANKPDWQGI